MIVTFLPELSLHLPQMLKASDKAQKQEDHAGEGRPGVIFTMVADAVTQAETAPIARQFTEEKKLRKSSISIDNEARKRKSGDYEISISVIFPEITEAAIRT